MGNYVIAGKGNVSQDVLDAGIKDLGDDHTFFVPWIGSENTVPSDGLRQVYDYLVDHAIPFTLIAKDRASVHPAVAGAASDIQESVNESPELNFSNVPTDSTALILWSDEDQEHSSNLVCAYHDRGHKLLDLTNGLTPIEIVDEETTPPPTKSTDSPTQEDDIPPLTDEDIASMPDGVRKQLDRSLGDTEVEDIVDTDGQASLVLITPDGSVVRGTVPMSKVTGLIDLTVWEE